MGFVKVVKNKAYYKRYQVKFRRRRQGKTDYTQRRGLVIQDKNKYNTPKYRLVVRFTNRDCICQIISAKLEGDYVLAAAYSHELTNYGLPAKVGLTNYASAYATGLLVARRALTKLGLADLYKGTATIDGEDYNVSTTEEASKQQDLKDDGEGGKRPFRVILDVGLARTTTGARIFGALKGACDGGLDIPHQTHRFPGANSDKEYDPAVHRKYIFGGHVAEYMEILKDEDKKRFDRQFSRFNAANVSADKLEGLYKKVHENIRKNPVATKKARDVPATRRQRRPRLSAPQKKANAMQKLAKLQRLAEQD